MKAATRPAYYQTQKLTQTQLTDYETAAQNQEDRILRIFHRKPHALLSAEDLQDHFSKNVPITSIRRALTNLATKEEIEKCGQADGQYGRPINLYQLKRD